MSSIYLPVFQSNAASDAADLLPRLLGGNVSLNDTLSFCRLCRIRGIAGLFLDGMGEPLHRELCRSGRALLHILPRMGDEKNATGRLFPFLDAVAAGDRECARAIAAIARATWNPDEEYEDDFLYVRFLMTHMLTGADVTKCADLLDRWGAVLDGASDVRFDLCCALLQHVAPDFEEALVSLLDEEKARYRRLSRAGALAQEIEATEANLSIEGIALVRVARANGLPVRSSYWGVPSLALKDVPAAFSDAAWQSV